MTARGKIVLTLLVLAVVGVGAGQWRNELASQRAQSRSVWTAVALAPLSPPASQFPASFDVLPRTRTGTMNLVGTRSKRFAPAMPASGLAGSPEAGC